MSSILRLAWVAALALLSVAPTSAAAESGIRGCMSEAEFQLADLVNRFRQENGLSSIPLSKTLTSVAQWHLADLRHATDDPGTLDRLEADLHRWYGIPGAPYTVTDQANCMWDKPAQISEGRYTSIGFELAATGFHDVVEVLDAWKRSPEHRDVLLNRGDWAAWDFNAMGVGIDEARGWCFVWFGPGLDLDGAAPPCPTSGQSVASVVAEVEASPNPFNPQVTISFELLEATSVVLTVHDVQGRLVRQFPAEHLTPGRHRFVWDGTDAAGLPSSSGTYFVRIRAGGLEQSIKVSMLK